MVATETSITLGLTVQEFDDQSVRVFISSHPGDRCGVGAWIDLEPDMAEDDIHRRLGILLRDVMGASLK